MRRKLSTAEKEALYEAFFPYGLPFHSLTDSDYEKMADTFAGASTLLAHHVDIMTRSFTGTIKQKTKGLFHGRNDRS